MSTPTGGGPLFVTTGDGAITISAPINDNGGAVTVVKSGGAGILTLSSTTSAFSGGLVLNAGAGTPVTIGTTFAAANAAVLITADTNLGLSTGGITFNGTAALSVTSASLNASRTITINNGAMAIISYGTTGTPTIAGKVTGTGGLFFTGSSKRRNLTLSNTANDFKGPLIISTSTVTPTVIAASLADSATANGSIRLGGSTGGGVFQWVWRPLRPWCSNNRHIDLASTTVVARLTQCASNSITVNGLAHH